MIDLATAVRDKDPKGRLLLLCLDPRDTVKETAPQAVAGRVVDTFDVTVSGERVKIYAISGNIADELAAIAEGFGDKSLASAATGVAQVPPEDGRRTFVAYRTMSEDAERTAREAPKAAPVQDLYAA